MIYSFTVASTLARLMGLGAFWILISGVMAAILDSIIDSGHRGHRRSAITHSIASAPAPLIIAFIAGLLMPLTGIGFEMDVLIQLGLIMSASFLGHLFWDSLTVNGIHVPGAGWVSLAHFESRGVINMIPVLFAVAIILLFWSSPFQTEMFL